MKQILVYRFDRPLPARITVKMPARAEIVSAANQYNKLVIFAKVDADWKEKPIKERVVKVIPAESTFEEGSTRFIDTVLFDAGALVVHIFDAGE